MHEFKHFVAATLQRNMKVGHELLAATAIINERIINQVGFQTADAVALNAIYFVERFYQIEKAFMGGFTKIANVYPREHNLFSAFGSGFFGLPHERGDSRIARKAASIGDGAVSAKVVAAVLHF